MSTDGLKGALALVTGAARGQGRAHAEMLAAAGATVIACDCCGTGGFEHLLPYPPSRPEELEETAARVRALGAECHPLLTDVRDEWTLRRAARAADIDLDAVDVLIGNAGIDIPGDIASLPAESWQAVLDVNLTGAWASVKAVVGGMRERRRGRIVLIAAADGRRGAVGRHAFAAAKWGVIGLTKSLALDLGRDGITVNAVCPSRVRTPLLENAAALAASATSSLHPTFAEAADDWRRSGVLPSDWSSPAEISRVVRYLLSDGALHVTGVALDVSHGQSARNTT